MFINDLFNDKDKPLNEVSNELLGRYKKAAGADATAADKRGDIKRGNKRFKGIVKATVKQGDNDVKTHKAQGVAEGSFGSGYGSVFTLHVNTGEKPATKTKTKKFKREDDAVLWAEDYADQHEMFPNLKMEIQDENGNVVWELEESQGVAEDWQKANYPVYHAKDLPTPSLGTTVKSNLKQMAYDNPYFGVDGPIQDARKEERRTAYIDADGVGYDRFGNPRYTKDNPSLSRNDKTIKAVKGALGIDEQAPPLNVPQGWEAKTQADGSTRISKIGSMSSADYKQNMANYKAQNWTPEKMVDYGQRTASGQGYTPAEQAANYQQQQKSFGQYADQPLQGVDEDEKKGLYYNVNKRKKAGTSRPAGHPKAPTPQAWKDAAKTAQKEDVVEGTKCNMTEEGRACPEHDILECPGYRRLMGEAFKMPPESVQDRMHRRHQELRKKSGLPDPEHYLKLKKQKEQELVALRAEIAADKEKGLTEERYLEELQRAGYDVITEKKIRQRLDPSCWKGYKKQGTKIKGGVRVNNCVPKK